MAYIVNYNPAADDIFVYNQPFTVWPTIQSQYALRENENLPLKNQTVVYNGETITYDIDLSGVQDFTRNVSYIYCNTCLQQHPQWPHCTGFWQYGLGVGNIVIGNPFGPQCTAAQPSNGFRSEPAKTINQFLTAPDAEFNLFPVNAKYWNSPNLWHTNVFRGGVLLQSESDDETYYITLGHPVTTSPCDYDFQISFFDRETNTPVTRVFTCPCTAWDLPLTGLPGSGALGCNNCCKAPYSIFTSGNETVDTADTGIRLFVMKSGQDPLPQSIKRYKPLIGRIRKDNWPIFGIDSSWRFIKAKTNPNATTQDTRIYRTREDGEDGNFRFARSKQITTNSAISWDGGEGDDGPYPNFTISETGETIFVGWNSSLEYHDFLSFTDEVTYNKPLTNNVPRPCIDGNIFYTEGDQLKFNTYCEPAFFHPELVIPGYPNNDIKIYTIMRSEGLFLADKAEKFNYYLEQLGKPKILFYRFPEFGSNETNDVYFPDTILDTDKKYPLFDSPYLSRESKNSFFPNTNLIEFREQRMLQASELNELQEKFYKKQSSLIKYYNKWLSKNNLKPEIKNILGFSEKFDLNWISTSLNANTFVKCNTAIPIETTALTVGSRNENEIAQIKLNPCEIMLYTSTNFSTNSNEVGTLDPSLAHNNMDFININSQITGELDLSKVTETNIHCITLKVDTNNIVSCNEYNELRDNSSQDNNSSAPCGANRNYIYPTNTLPIVQQDIDINDIVFDQIVIGRSQQLTLDDLTPFNYISTENTYTKYLLGYMKRENGQINFYYANGVKIENI